uniref:C2H2-type domain-containing protein n=1 Tax=Magallana gigas TaxID=29159 RepID=A0A8W8NXJ6_MAGGI
MIVSLVYLVFHYSFIDDCLDAYIVTACLHLLDLSDIDEISSRKQTLFDILPKEEQNSFISQISKVILEKYIKIPNDLPTLSTETATMDTQKRQIEAMFDNRQQRYVCEVCDKQYKTANDLQRHLKDQHLWNITENSGVNIP